MPNGDRDDVADRLSRRFDNDEEADEVSGEEEQAANAQQPLMRRTHRMQGTKRTREAR